MTNPIKPSPTKLLQAFVLMGAMGLFASTAHAETWIATPDGCKAHNPFPKPKETVTWTGDCVGGYVQGQGTFSWYLDGKLTDVFIGNYHKGKMHGKGSYTWRNGTKYEGDFVNDMLHGFGKFSFKDHAEIADWGMDGVGVWQGKVYVVQGIFIYDVFETECPSKEFCQAMYEVETVRLKNR